MVGNENISKTLRMMHDAARNEFSSSKHHRGIDILNDARILEERVGFKNQATESILEIAQAYFSIKNYDLALWFAEEVLEKIQKNRPSSTASKAIQLIERIKVEANTLLVT